MDNGFAITVERDPQRIFEDAEYEKYGARPLPVLLRARVR